MNNLDYKTSKNLKMYLIIYSIYEVFNLKHSNNDERFIN